MNTNFDREPDAWRIGEPPLSDAEIAAWLDNLAPSDAQRATRLRELLRFAVSDGLSAEDRLICQSALRRVEARIESRGLKV